MKINLNFFSFNIFLISNIFSFFQNLNNDNNFKYVINNYYYVPSEEFIIDINLDEFISGNINDNNTNFYKVLLLNDSEQVFFDFQSEYGCLYINIEEGILINTSYHFYFCSKGINNIYTLNKSDIIEKLGNNTNYSLYGLNLIIGVGLSPLEFENEINFDYSLKISLRKTIINIFEIKSKHKILCKTEKEDKTNRCIFIITNNIENGENLIIYSKAPYESQNKLNIFANYINRDEYDNWNTDFLVDNIPKIGSNFTNYNTEKEFIIIPNYLETKKYIYISVESENEIILELFIQNLLKEDDIALPKINEIQFFSLKKNSCFIHLNHMESIIDEISLSLITLNGKAKINLGYDESTEYILDIRENKLLLINLESCLNNINTCKLIINNLEYDDENGYIFYISYKIKSKNILNELDYGKSNKLLYKNIQYPILIYTKLPNIDLPININLQIYNVQNINFEIETLLLSQQQIYELKLNYSYINDFKNKIRNKFDLVLSAANIYLTVSEMKSFNITKDLWLIICITKNDNYFIDKLIIGSTISQINNLIYPSERIYHYGKLNNENKIVYKLKGRSKYHLMRLEFGCNSDLINWSVKRNNDDNYRNNDTDLSFVTEKWNNGRELLTMYIERGEDIYLTIFPKDEIKNTNLTNFVFKYINSEKNGDFKNYINVYDSLYYDRDKIIISINKINNIPSTSNINYYLKVINESQFIKNEEINTIALTESISYLVVKGEINNNNYIFYLKNKINIDKIYYVNAYGIIVENCSDIEFVSYSSFIIKKVINNSNKGLIIASIVIVSLITILIIIQLILYCYNNRYKRELINLDYGF